MYINLALGLYGTMIQVLWNYILFLILSLRQSLNVNVNILINTSICISTMMVNYKKNICSQLSLNDKF